jgi:cytochrome c oxidase cbb3-type subunit III
MRRGGLSTWGLLTSLEACRPAAGCHPAPQGKRPQHVRSIFPRLLKFNLGVVVACGLMMGQESELIQPKATLEDRAEGRRIFGTQCSYCHGPKGEGGQGAVLAVPRLAHAPDDISLFRVIRDGIAGTKMPASALAPNQVWQLVAYVRTLGRVEGAKSTGDPARGSQIYAGKGNCAQCHAVKGHGGGLGPDLTDIGAHRNAAQIRTALIDPDDSVPLDYMQVRVVVKDGSSLSGVRVNEDSFSIQIRDLSNHFHSYWKSELTEISKDPKRSLMPSYRNKLSATELDDLIAYLESLQGGQ